MMLTDLRLAMRRLVSAPALTTIATLTLALGIAATTGIYAVYDAVLLKPLPFADPDRIVAISVRDAQGTAFGLAGGTFEAVQTLPQVERAAVTVGADKTLIDTDEPAVVRASLAGPAFFHVFRVRPYLGRLLAEGDAGSNVAVISHRLWLGHFGGDRSVVGRVVRLDSAPCTIVGVLPPAARFPEDSDVWLPYQMPASERAQVGAGPFLAVGRVHDASATRTSQPVANAGEGHTIDFVPLRDFLGDPYRYSLNLMLAVAAGLLLVACVNVANLRLALGTARQRELEVCAALGASRWRLVRPAVLEAGLLTGLATATGISLAMAVAAILPALDADLPRADEIALDWRVLAVAVGLSAVCIGATGWLPAWAFTGRRQALGRTASTTVTRPHAAGGLLLGAQVAISTAMCLAGLLVLTSLSRLTSVDVGLRADDVTVASLRLPPSVARDLGRGLYPRLLRQLQDGTDVALAAGMSQVPLGPSLARAVSVSAGGRVLPQSRTGPRVRLVTPRAFETLGVPVVRGRDFVDGDAAGATPVALVNETLAAALWGGGKDFGEEVTVAGGPADGRYRVVGVVADFRSNARRAPQPEVYLAAAQHPGPLTLVLKSRLPAAGVAAGLRTVLSAEAPGAAVTSLMTLRDLGWAANAYLRSQAALLGACAWLATLFTVTGVATMVLYATALRTREIGIRIAVGAAPRQVVGGELRALTWPLAAGGLAGLMGGYLLTRVLEQQALLFEVRRFEPSLYALTVFGLGVLAVGAAWISARRAAAIDPVVALRAE